MVKRFVGVVCCCLVAISAAIALGGCEGSWTEYNYFDVEAHEAMGGIMAMLNDADAEISIEIDTSEQNWYPREAEYNFFKIKHNGATMREVRNFSVRPTNSSYVGRCDTIQVQKPNDAGSAVTYVKNWSSWGGADDEYSVVANPAGDFGRAGIAAIAKAVLFDGNVNTFYANWAEGEEDGYGQYRLSNPIEIDGVTYNDGQAWFYDYGADWLGKRFTVNLWNSSVYPGVSLRVEVEEHYGRAELQDALADCGDEERPGNPATGLYEEWGAYFAWKDGVITKGQYDKFLQPDNGWGDDDDYGFGDWNIGDIEWVFTILLPMMFADALIIMSFYLRRKWNKRTAIICLTMVPFQLIVGFVFSFVSTIITRGGLL